MLGIFLSPHLEVAGAEGHHADDDGGQELCQAVVEEPPAEDKVHLDPPVVVLQVHVLVVHAETLMGPFIKEIYPILVFLTSSCI